MKRKLSWELISDFFEGQWVELHDFEWEWDEPHPRRSLVRHHAQDRETLLKMIQMSERLDDAVIVYIGYPAAVVRHALDSARA